MLCSRIHGGVFALLLSVSLALGQEGQSFAIVPTFHDRLNLSGQESVLHLQRQQFIVFVYRDAIAVYAEADFVNSGVDTLSQEFGLPSTGHDENGDDPGGKISTGILSAQVWLGDERVAPDIVRDGSEDWYTIRARFEPGERRSVKAIFWAQTSLTDIDSLPGLDTTAIPAGNRGFMVDLFHAGVWNNIIERIDVTVLLKEGMSFHDDAFTVEPDTYQIQDSILTWTFRNLEPSLSDNIVVSYTPSGGGKSSAGTMATLSTYIVQRAYDDLIHYVDQVTQE